MMYSSTVVAKWANGSSAPLKALLPRRRRPRLQPLSPLWGPTPHCPHRLRLRHCHHVGRLEAPEEEPTLGAVLARRYVGILGSAEALAARITQGIREAGWEHIPIAEILGDGVPWIGTVPNAHVPAVRQTLDDYHLSEHLHAFATLQYPNDPARAKAWVEQILGALLTDRVGAVLSALKRMRPWKKTIRKVLAQLIGDGERNRTRIRYQEPWHSGLAVGSGAVEGACKQILQHRFKRAGMHRKLPGFLNVLALRLARLNGIFQAF
jgi:hypothetical protein